MYTNTVMLEWPIEFIALGVVVVASGVLPRHALYHDYVRYAVPGDRRCSANVWGTQFGFQVAPYASHYLPPKLLV